ncbi:phenazine biosynthesis protein PhzE [Rhizobium viscosum]|uniref:anthranilate synthase n=1 Tax=Rhizobium viscosum TaxID=1673 RepID=A0ABR9IYG2_RHIVS|nr:anthranilate synthase family protein [Rhizobium viscosum]MBE1508218.1 phenazine biosynthesis protein phzE [Rhizobium viscosum]
MRDNLLQNIASGLIDQPYALIARRSSKDQPAHVDVVTGSARTFERLADLTTVEAATRGAVGGERLLVLVPFRQIAEVGYDCIDDNERLRVIAIETQESFDVPHVLEALPRSGVQLDNVEFDVADEIYAARVERLIAEEIGRGEGANFVLSRSLCGTIRNFSQSHALSIFRELLLKETGAYWTFLIRIDGRTFIGASPEQQITLQGGTAVMNPISGTYRYPPSGPKIDQVLDFLYNEKETDELFMVADEELKMFGRFCPDGGRLRGPFLKEMSRLAHTEYYIEGRTSASAAALLRHTMLAPTVTGSPIKNACRVIAKYEERGRGYYAGVVALIGQDPEGAETLDSAILIRTAHISDEGEVRIPVGSTIVRHSDPAQEAAETTAKATGLLSAFTSARMAPLGSDDAVRRALSDRNRRVASFWLARPGGSGVEGSLKGKVLVLDADDDFTQMLAHQLRALGLEPSVYPATRAEELGDEYELTLLGPGPGNPLDDGDGRVAGIRRALQARLTSGRPFVSVCLSHQILCRHFGLTVGALENPNQGVQRRIDFFGRSATVGFYNTFAARCAPTSFVSAGALVQVCRDPETGEVHALRGSHFASMQFHPESVLSIDGFAIMAEEISRLCRWTEPRHGQHAFPVSVAR